jgi:hypothetical protein
VEGAFAGRTVPKASSNDLTAIDRAIDKEVRSNCPGLVKDGDLVREGELPHAPDPAFLHRVAAQLPSCGCETDLSVIELIPWLAKQRLLTLVPLHAVASNQPPLPVAAPDATFEDVVRANGGKPLAIAPPPPLPPLRSRP